MMKPGAKGADLAEFAKYIAEHGPHKTLSTSKRVRVVFNRTIIIDTTKAIYVWEHAAYPQFYIPGKALENCTLKEKQPVEHGGSQVAQVVELSVTADGKEAKTDRVVRFADNSSLGVLAGMVRLEFGSMDQWMEEDAPIFVHPKDPFKRRHPAVPPPRRGEGAWQDGRQDPIVDAPLRVGPPNEVLHATDCRRSVCSSKE